MPRTRHDRIVQEKEKREIPIYESRYLPGIHTNDFMKIIIFRQHKDSHSSEVVWSGFLTNEQIRERSEFLVDFLWTNLFYAAIFMGDQH